ncbi:MAG: hypothetical protein NTY64_22015, partial [Deltaproteobacteria bacterium]|nr:hypothetical protein [Deltaproteobacteria bacterium]
NYGLCEIYKWTNDDGSVGFTDNLSKVPEKYRKQIEIKKERHYENKGSNDPRARGDSTEKKIKETPISVNRENLKQELSEEEKRKGEEEMRSVWENMRKALINKK